MSKTRTDAAIAYLIAGVFVAILSTAFAVYANPTYFAQGVTTLSNATTTGNASTSISYMTPGTGTTTTNVYDTYASTTAGGVPYKTDYAGLLVQFTASSTASVLTFAVEYSDDGVDWYRNFVLDPMQIGTTTTPYSLNTSLTTKWLFASSTLGTTTVANPNRSTAAMMIPTPFRYTRIIFSITGANGGVWARLVPVKQQK